MSGALDPGARDALPRQNVQPTGMSGWVGWVAFAGVMMTILGTFHVIEGLVAIFNDEYFAVAKSGLVVTVDYTVWGWVHLLGGIVIIAAGVAVFTGKVWARAIGVTDGGDQRGHQHRLPVGLPDLVDDHDHPRHPGDLGTDRPRRRAAGGLLVLPPPTDRDGGKQTGCRNRTRPAISAQTAGLSCVPDSADRQAGDADRPGRHRGPQLAEPCPSSRT